MKIAVTSDNTCDLPQELIEKHNIYIFNIPVIMGDEEYRDNVSGQTIFDYVDKTGNLPKTAALSEYEYHETFEKLSKEYDAVIHFALSFGISSTGTNALNASKDFENVHVVDTKQLSTGSGLLVLRCLDLIAEGRTPEEIIKTIEVEREKVQTSFIINKLNYLKKGGRCSSIAYIGANLLGMKVCINVVDGKMVAGKKYLGKFNVVLGKYKDDLIKDCEPDYNRVFVTSSSEMPGIREEFIESVKQLGFKEVLTTYANSTICAHCGPDTIGLLYIKK